MLAIIVLNVDKKLWQPVELETINSRNTSFSAYQNQINTDNVVLILFDDRTQFLLRQNGLPIKDFEKKGRDLLASAIHKLEGSGAKAIGINFNLNSPSDPKSDLNLATTISRYKNIVIADSIHSFPFYVKNNILKSAAAIGYGELFSDYDKIVHKIKLTDKGYKDVPSFSYALYRVLSGGKDVNKKIKQKNEFYLRYPQKPFTVYSFIDLIDGQITQKKLKNKIVILGSGLRSKLISDQLLNPCEKYALISDSKVQAIAFLNLYQEAYLFKYDLNDYKWFFVIFSILIGILFSSMQTVKRISIASFLFVMLLAGGQIAYNSYHIVLEIVPLVFLLLGNLLMGSLVFLQLNLQEQNLNLEEALTMLSKRSEELENSRQLLQNKNIQLSGTLAELHERVEELRKVRKQLSNRREEERKRIARELHDDTLARITDLKRYIESVINSDAVALQVKKDLGITIHTLDNVTYEIRRIINALRPSMLDNALGLIPAIENLLDELAKRSSFTIKTKFKTNLSRLKLSDPDEINLYRIIQEALNNVFKHSQARNVEVILKEQPGQVLVIIKDDGIGVEANTPQDGKEISYGLIDMKERADLIGAEVQYIKTSGGCGTTIEITIPLTKIKKAEKTSDAEEMFSNTPSSVI